MMKCKAMVGFVTECGRDSDGLLCSRHCECPICPIVEGEMSEYAREYARDYHAGSDAPHKTCYHGSIHTA